ncbi:MAG: Carbohydrate-binding family 9 [Clostridia bacterium]|jgi:hypothetical protein|nr:Carbohydrate-binding family 9 [Clostridia bacterium]
MKKIIIIGLTVVLLFILSAASLAYTGNSSYGSVPKAYEELIIDGVKDEMYSKGLQIDITRPNPEIEGFATAKTWYLWTDGWIYIYAEILDDEIIEPDPTIQETSPWSCDSLEIFIDEDNDALELQQYRIDVTGWPCYYTQEGVADYGAEIVGTKFGFAQKRVDGGYNVEFKVPTTAVEGKEIGLNMQINDRYDADVSQVIVYPQNSLGSGGSWEGETFDFIVLGTMLEKPVIEAPVEEEADNVNPGTSDESIIYFTFAILSIIIFVAVNKKTA